MNKVLTEPGHTVHDAVIGTWALRILSRNSLSISLSLSLQTNGREWNETDMIGSANYENTANGLIALNSSVSSSCHELCSTHTS
jgi:hypothetical protein